ncbi:hypothetical protein evm_003254 [Chilo suppressalis]|nr:hypothetical protein evm_003254 [Chilo suppressalis]
MQQRPTAQRTFCSKELEIIFFLVTFMLKVFKQAYGPPDAKKNTKQPSLLVESNRVLAVAYLQPTHKSSSSLNQPNNSNKQLLTLTCLSHGLLAGSDLPASSSGVVLPTLVDPGPSELAYNLVFYVLYCITVLAFSVHCDKWDPITLDYQETGSVVPTRSPYSFVMPLCPSTVLLGD